MGARAIDVANFFINEFKDSDDPMTKTRIQKFMYYAQAQCLVRLGRPLFEEDFQAWKYGPVIPEISMNFVNRNDGEPIRRVIGKFDLHVFTPEELEILVDVSRYCGQYSTATLSEKTHVQDGPWESVHKETGSPAVIPKCSIRDYYSKHEKIPSLIDKALSRIPTEGYTDENGHLVLPSGCDWE